MQMWSSTAPSPNRTPTTHSHCTVKHLIPRGNQASLSCIHEGILQCKDTSCRFFVSFSLKIAFVGNENFVHELLPYFFFLTSETSDDILAKYRKQPVPAEVANQVKEKAEVRDESDSDSTPAYDPNNLENCKAFLDAKKKLRMVLSTADFQVRAFCGDANGNFELSELVFVSQKTRREISKARTRNHTLSVCLLLSFVPRKQESNIAIKKG